MACRGGPQEFPPSNYGAFVPYLTADEGEQISRQFQGPIWRPNAQVMWSGVPRELAQKWADDRGMQTLTTAMGFLMVPEHPSCPKSRKSAHSWSLYIKGASALFAWHISKGEKVTVLSPPPPDRFNPGGFTNYQAIEEPILKGVLGSAVSRIEMVHPTVKGAEDFAYQTWPTNETDIWIARFGTSHQKKQRWRAVGSSKFLRVYTILGAATAPQPQGYLEALGENGVQRNPGTVQSGNDDESVIRKRAKRRGRRRRKPKENDDEGGVITKRQKSVETREWEDEASQVPEASTTPEASKTSKASQGSIASEAQNASKETKISEKTSTTKTISKAQKASTKETAPKPNTDCSSEIKILSPFAQLCPFDYFVMFLC
ncbi:hypothetical protein GX51_03720 [Blastomyces parvus]|uniref:Uncharacterized protein n=1 Tax=Blastomyces parvus TaxID=2060905 RepID=A0A2B7X5B4_9EURO|nr:hypothetical protein GX51_03720 [Blastomyces parvus]